MLKTRPNQMIPSRSMNTNGITSEASAISAPSVLPSLRAIGLMFLIHLVLPVGTADARSFYPLRRRRDQPHRHRRCAVAKNNRLSRDAGSATGQVDDRHGELKRSLGSCCW